MVNVDHIRDTIAGDPALISFLNHMQPRNIKIGSRVPEMIRLAFGGDTCREIADIMGCSPPAVSKSLTDWGLTGLLEVNRQRRLTRKRESQAALVETTKRVANAIVMRERKGARRPREEGGHYVITTPGGDILFDKQDKTIATGFSWALSGKSVWAKTPLGRLNLARAIMGTTKGEVVDHINGNPFDNRRANLRVATYKQNSWNSRKSTGKKSAFKGVSIGKRGRWFAYARKDGITHDLGRFDTEVEAALAYDEFARREFREFACLNFPKPGEQSAHRGLRLVAA